jgi:hypothetical protein
MEVIMKAALIYLAKWYVFAAVSYLMMEQGFLFAISRGWL